MGISLICPVCGNQLSRAGNSYCCEKRHSFDLSKQGYVNLLLSSSRHRHGDDRIMVRARRDFLNKGYYDRLSRKIVAFVDAVSGRCPGILDAGCGEGKYTSDLYAGLVDSGKDPDIIGIDISKDALCYAAKRIGQARFAVASSSSLPVENASIDIVTNIFSPLVPEEFHRVLRSGGYLLRVIPLEEHLWELKSLVYTNPYPNDLPDPEIEGFLLERTEDLKYMITLSSNEDIMHLFMMTPYYYKTGADDQAKAKSADNLVTQLAFRLLLYRRLP